MNDNKINARLDWNRVRHLFKIGIIAAFLVLAGDMLLGWGVADEAKTGIDQYFSWYLTICNTRIFLSALLGLVGIPVECLSFFGIYRVIASRSEKLAHAYRAGIIGMTAFGALVHVLCCATVYHFKSFYALDTANAADGAVRFALYFMLPAAVLFAIFFFLTAAVQIGAFAKGMTPYPKWCAIFSVFAGFIVIAAMRLFGNNAFAYAISTGWISIGNIYMLAGLLIVSKKVIRK
jgi:hypothetical protein